MARMLAAEPPAFAPLYAHTSCAQGVAKEGHSRTVLVPAISGLAHIPYVRVPAIMCYDHLAVLYAEL